MPDRFNTDDMLDVYLFENQKLLEKLEITVLEQQNETIFDDETINEIFRTIHTIKGSSGVMMFDDITTVSHKLEDIFYLLRESHPKHVPHLELVKHVLEVIDFIKEELGKIQRGEAANGDFHDLIEKLDAFLQQLKVQNAAVSSDVSGQHAKQETQHAKQEANQKFYIAPAAGEAKQYFPIREEDELPIFIDLESSVEEIEARAEILQKQKLEEKARILEPGDFVVQSREPGKATVLAKDRKDRTETAKYVNVEIAKLDRLMELVGKLVVSDSAMQMKAISKDLQKTVISMRKVPLQGTFQKMYRVVFDASRKLGKDIDLIMEGEMTEVDRSIVEHILDPLMHLIRNAIDHGIETIEERVQIGKPAKGKIHLIAENDAENLWIVVEDDGSGLDRDNIIERARRQGLLEEDKPESAYTDEEVYQFITLPGFSTSKEITEYSGRGVGLDVVVSNISRIGGTLEIESEKHKGCKMMLKIPLM